MNLARIEGELAVIERMWRALHPRRTHKAGSAESILRHCLRTIGLTREYRDRLLTGPQALGLLEAIRSYARDWLRHEAEVLIRHHARALSDAMRHHVGRFFARARQFVREAIVAGVMALHGPGEIDVDDLAEADREADAQAVYLDRFAADVAAGPPPELAVPTAAAAIGAMTAAEFAARAEMYGAAAWGGAQAVARGWMIRRGAVEERRVHRGDDPPCATCAVELGKGWSVPGTLLPIGRAECRTNCHCHFEYRMDDGTIRWIGGRAA